MRLVGFGDSITAGVFLKEEETFLYKIGLKYGLETVNAGVPGQTTSEAILRMQADVLDHHPDICIIEFGMNDHMAMDINVHKVEPATFKMNLIMMINRLYDINCIPILCTISPIIEGDATAYYYSRHPVDWYKDPLGAQTWLHKYSQIIREVAAEMNVRLADVAAIFDHYLAQGGALDGVEGILLNLDNAGSADGVHPTAIGHDLYAAAIAEQLDTIYI